MKNHHTIKTIVCVTAFAGLLGVSAAGMAQSKAIESLNAPNAQSSQNETIARHPMADRLATALDAYNNQDQAGNGLRSQQVADSASQPVSRVAQELSTEIEAYNSNTSSNPVPQTQTPDSEEQQPATPMADRLASELTTYNRTNGSRIN